MAVDVVRYGSRHRRQNAAHAAKVRREKIILAVGALLLVGLVAWQGPKTLKKLHGKTAPAAPASSPSPSSATTATQAPKAVTRAELQRLAAYAGKDPFVPQVNASAGSAPPPLASGPAVRSSDFVAKDPFVPQLTLTGSGSSAPSTPGEASRAPATRVPYIVMVASIPIGEGRAAAERAAARARTRGIQSVKIAVSSNYATLRSGFYAVYSGPYETLGQTLSALERVRGHGYVSAYTRQIAR